MSDQPKTEKTAIAQRVEQRMEDLGISQAEVARRGRFNRAFISDIIVGRKVKLRDRNYVRLAHALLTTPQYLRFGIPPTKEEMALLGAGGLLPPSSAEGSEQSAEDMEAIARAFDDFSLEQSSRIEPIAEARRTVGWTKTPAIPLFRSEGRSDGAAVIRNPAAQMVQGPHFAVRDWYALAIADATMAPRYEAGDYVYAAQGNDVRAKDYVVVRVASRVGRTPVQLAYVRQLLRRTPDEIVVRQLSPSIETVIPQATVLSIDRIVVAGEVFGGSDF
ncbi:LexA family transcriptional regulator [Devosia sp.]|uniref:LexA family transcriptional regulator n=1 Tax=Devosia sp. TaxID=1871048 RepID=UPI001AFF3ACC|nr:LexA family transcriptional regulator [Devosia sp.]MBO9591152.1 hypothetical protein [Devosia sp.]